MRLDLNKMEPMWPASLLAVALLAPQELPARVERRLSAMGTWLELEVRAADRPAALVASEAAVRAIEAVEARLSTWREDSELARLNRAPVGSALLLSPELAADLARAQGFWRASEGAFDPGLGALVAAWGLRSGGREPSSVELEAARAVGGFAAFELDGRRAVRRHASAAIEEGGFGKGVGLDAALSALRTAGVIEARLDFGGQLATLGAPCTCALADPRARARPVLELSFPTGSLATSGNSEHGILVAGERRGHLLDPRSGAPAEDFGSLSVWAADATAADCLSKLYVLGPDGALRWQAAHPEVELIVLVPKGQRLVARATSGWRGRLRALVPELELSFAEERTARAPEPQPAPADR
ncbi:MAG: FAD:protein FMN transferase [Planctomycetes bacterium]|nr:FAD:protein FMN transferase [Planctomycetota bacterium]